MIVLQGYPSVKLAQQLANHLGMTDPANWLEISEGGNAQHLERLRKMDHAAGSGTIFREVADALEPRLREASQKG